MGKVAADVDSQQARVARKAAIKRVAESVEAAAESSEAAAKSYFKKHKKLAKAKWATSLLEILRTIEFDSGNHIGNVLVEYERRNAKNQVMSAYWAVSEDRHLVAKFPIFGKHDEDLCVPEPILVSDHALERVIERTSELRIPLVLSELAPALFSISLVLTWAADYLDEPLESREHVAVPSPSGIAIVVIGAKDEKYSAVVKTWLSFDIVRSNAGLKSLYDGTYEQLDRKHLNREGLYKVSFNVNCVNGPVLVPRRIHEGDYAWRQLREYEAQGQGRKGACS